MMLLQNISIYVFLISLILGLLSLWSMGKVSGYYFDERLRKLGQSLPIVARVCCSGASARAGCYLLLVLSNGNPFVNYGYRWWSASFIKNYHRNFGDADYRAMARKRDWVMAVLFWGSVAGFLISLVIICLSSVL